MSHSWSLSRRFESLKGEKRWNGWCSGHHAQLYNMLFLILLRICHTNRKLLIRMCMNEREFIHSNIILFFSYLIQVAAIDHRKVIVPEKCNRQKKSWNFIHNNYFYYCKIMLLVLFIDIKFSFSFNWRLFLDFNQETHSADFALPDSPIWSSHIISSDWYDKTLDLLICYLLFSQIGQAHTWIVKSYLLFSTVMKFI